MIYILLLFFISLPLVAAMTATSSSGVLSLSSSSDTDDAPGMPTSIIPVLGKVYSSMPRRSPLSRSVSLMSLSKKAAPIETRRVSDPRLEEYFRMIIYESDRDEDGVHIEAMRVLVAVKMFRFPRERIVRITTRSTGADFETVESVQIIGLP